MIIILVALNKSGIEKESVAHAISMDRAVRPPRNAIADINSSTDANVHSDTASMQSTILIGMSSRFDSPSARLSEALSEGRGD